MRKTTVIIIFALIMIFSLTALVGAQVSPRPISPFIPSVFFEVPPFAPTGMPAISHDPTQPIKMTLSPAEQVALQNLEVGKWTVIRFNFPPAFNGKKLVWTSSNPDVALSDGQGNWGLVLGVGPGTTTITVSTEDGSFSYSFQVIVT